uniref:Uncharacterized protein n=1 Tax=Megaselia scalaris TaxID=36166 RepID=T1GZ88_MEGSC
MRLISFAAARNLVRYNLEVKSIDFRYETEKVYTQLTRTRNGQRYKGTKLEHQNHVEIMNHTRFKENTGGI